MRTASTLGFRCVVRGSESEWPFLWPLYLYEEQIASCKSGFFVNYPLLMVVI